eukprot:Gb_00696 [translate_table: standard]
MKLDTIEKHAGKVYEKESINGEMKNVIRWKTVEECRHIKYANDYEQYLISKGKLEASKGTITSLFGKMMVTNLLSKTVQLSTVFHILSRGRPMTNFPEYMNFLSFLEVSNFPTSHWSISSGWEWERYIAQVEMEDLQEKIRTSRFLALSLDEVTAIDNTSWVNSSAENLFEVVIKNLKDIGGMSNAMIAQKLVCVGANGASVMQGQWNGLCVRMQHNKGQFTSTKSNSKDLALSAPKMQRNKGQFTSTKSNSKDLALSAPKWDRSQGWAPVTNGTQQEVVTEVSRWYSNNI